MDEEHVEIMNEVSRVLVQNGCTNVAETTQQIYDVIWEHLKDYS